eukprot:gene15066-6231_t
MGVLELNGVDSKKVLATLDEPCSGVPRKRRRLDDLTAEERVLRRKLKNRVAAQTARDRKKARMSELECIVTQIERENHLLKTSNEELRARLQMVSEENIKLKDRFGLSPHSTSSDHEYAAPCPLPQSAKSSSKERIDVTDIISDTDQIVIKTEEGLPEYASFRNSEDINIIGQASKETEVDEVLSAIPFKVEECDSDIEDALSSVSGSSPSSPDSGIDGDTLEDICLFGDVPSLVGNSSIDEILINEGDVKSIAATLDPQIDDAVVDDMMWEDPFMELFPSLMAV